MTAYLEIHPTEPVAPSSKSAVLVFETKTWIPFAWYLFFEPDDFASIGPKDNRSTVLKRSLEPAIELARRRTSALRGFFTPELATLLDHFIGSVAASAKGILVLDSYRLEATRSELVAPLKWLAAFEKAPGPRHLARGETLFGDGEGLSFEDEDNESEGPAIGVWEVGRVTGWPVGAKEISWFDKQDEGPVAPEASAQSVAALASVWAQPDDPGVRRACGERLTALGDPRGDFIALQCREALTAKQERQVDKLLELHDFRAPFDRAHVSFEKGFAAKVSFQSAPPVELVGHPAWSTVHTVEAYGAVSLLAHPVMRAQRIIVAAPDVLALAKAGVALPFKSICFGEDHAPETWSALASTAAFPELVEVFIKTFSVWLSAGAQMLLEARPTISVRTGQTPSVDIDRLRALTAEEHAARLARWKNPPGPLLAGPRADNPC